MEIFLIRQSNGNMPNKPKGIALRIDNNHLHIKWMFSPTKGYYYLLMND